MAFALPPVPQALGIWHQFIARQTETLVLREKVMSLSGDSYDITLASGQPILRIQGKTMSISGRKNVFDMAGNHLFDIIKEPLHLHATFCAVEPREGGNKLLVVKSSFALFGSKATATFTNPATGSPETLVMEGNFFASSATIVDQKNSFVVGQINRKRLSGRDILFGQQTYNLTVPAGVDLALMATMCVCMDEKNNEGKTGIF